MGKFTLEINTDGAAFCDPETGEEHMYYEAEEILRILREELVEKEMCPSDVLCFSLSHKLRDINGNVVGRWDWY